MTPFQRSRQWDISKGESGERRDDGETIHHRSAKGDRSAVGGEVVDEIEDEFLGSFLEHLAPFRIGLTAELCVSEDFISTRRAKLTLV